MAAAARAAAGAAVGAGTVGVDVEPPDSERAAYLREQQYLDARVADCEAAVQKIKALIVGANQSLAAAERELDDAREAAGRAA